MKRKYFLLFIYFTIVLGCIEKPGRISGVITFYNKNQPDYMSNIYIVDYSKIDTIEFNYILDYFRVIDLVKTYDYYNGVIVFENIGISLKTHKMLWGLKGNICVLPDCNKVLLVDETLNRTQPFIHVNISSPDKSKSIKDL